MYCKNKKCCKKIDTKEREYWYISKVSPISVIDREEFCSIKCLYEWLEDHISFKEPDELKNKIEKTLNRPYQ